MAKYTINCGCGHTITEQLFGKQSERDRRIAWREQSDCPSCWAAKKNAAERAKKEKMKSLKNELAGKYILNDGPGKGEHVSVSIVNENDAKAEMMIDGKIEYMPMSIDTLRCSIADKKILPDK